jgi:hypothetical protein
MPTAEIFWFQLMVAVPRDRGFALSKTALPAQIPKPQAQQDINEVGEEYDI